MKKPGDHDGPTRDEDGPSRPGNGRASSETDAARDDHGTEVVGDVIAVFLIDLASIDVGFIEEFRLRTGRAGELLRSHGLDRSRPYRAELRLARRLINKFFEVAEVDLPPEDAP